MIDRQAAARTLAAALTDRLVVTGLGNAISDLYHAGDRALNFYSAGAMGMASSIALGLARARPADQVVCVEGDGSLLMNLGSLATLGRYGPPNLLCVVWDNGAFQITGGQPTSTASGLDLATVGRGCGIASSRLVDSLADFEAALRQMLDAAGPHLLVAKVDRTLAEGYRPRKAMLIKHRFMRRLGTLPDAAALAWE
ncbi:MAG: hypothetical protein IT305_29470 [Chloroflexi bacterium]|nr:hypothetical protein [Chloroflexota bacterium]